MSGVGDYVAGGYSFGRQNPSERYYSSRTSRRCPFSIITLRTGFRSSVPVRAFAVHRDGTRVPFAFAGGLNAVALSHVIVGRAEQVEVHGYTFRHKPYEGVVVTDVHRCRLFKRVVAYWDARVAYMVWVD